MDVLSPPSGLFLHVASSIYKETYSYAIYDQSSQDFNTLLGTGFTEYIFYMTSSLCNES
jgi:hypothetical protein